MRRITEDEQTLRERTAYLHGRIEREIEAFADSINVPKVELTERMGALLLGIGPGYGDYLSHLQGGGHYLEAGAGSPEPPALESPSNAPSSSPQPQRGITESVSPAPAPPHEVKRGSKASKGYWAKMTPIQRRREMQRRQSLWSAAAKKKWGSPKTKRPTAKKTKTKKPPIKKPAAPVLPEAA